MPLRRDRPDMNIEHVGDSIGENRAPGIFLDGSAGMTEQLPQALECACLDASLVGQRLDGDARSQLSEKVACRALVGRWLGWLLDFTHVRFPETLCRSCVHGTTEDGLGPVFVHGPM